MMRVILLSCLLYLIGIVVVLYLKPNTMFDSKGIWKEFSFNSDENHTWFPFWLFCILWSFISFFIINFFFGKSILNNTVAEVTEVAKPGYYVLDKNNSVKKGFPRYVYLGSNMPSDNRDEY